MQIITIINQISIQPISIVVRVEKQPLDATDSEYGQRNLIEVSSNEDVAKEDDVSTIVSMWYMSV